VASDHDVLIVGGGPVGMGLAIDLGQRGVRTAVIERHHQSQPVPKGQNLTQRTMEHFWLWGVEQEVRAARTIPPEYGIGGLTAYGTLLSGHHYDWMQRELVRPFYLTDNERLPQYATEAVLRRRAGALADVDIHYGWTAEEVRQDDESAAVTMADADGQRRTLRGRCLVGCDGSRSIVREQAGISQTQRDHDRRMVLLVFRSRGLHDLLARFPGKSFYCVLHPELEGYWKFFGRVDLGNTWFFHAPVPHGTTAENYDFERCLHEAAGAPFEVDFEHIGFWDLRIAMADNYRRGRILIAGDAAHSHPPYGAFGINTGFEDARNLGWKLAAVLQGWGGARLLDSYDEERRPVFASTARDFIEQAIADDRDFLAAFAPERDLAAFERAWAARGSGARAEVNAYEPHYEGSSIIQEGSGCPSAVGSHRFTARPGHHLAPQPLSAGGTVFDRLGDGFTLLALDAADEPIRRFETAARELGVPLAVIRDSRQGGRERYEAALVLVRPDHFVAWVGDEVTDAARVLCRAAGLPPIR
jgi:2-polyprenyl-6-methoxyphenol hydroxylase-like FAD-dependent oxidoreductase